MGKKCTERIHFPEEKGTTRNKHEVNVTGRTRPKIVSKNTGIK